MVYRGTAKDGTEWAVKRAKLMTNAFETEVRSPCEQTWGERDRGERQWRWGERCEGIRVWIESVGRVVTWLLLLHGGNIAMPL